MKLPNSSRHAPTPGSSMKHPRLDSVQLFHHLNNNTPPIILPTPTLNPPTWLDFILGEKDKQDSSVFRHKLVLTLHFLSRSSDVFSLFGKLSISPLNVQGYLTYSKTIKIPELINKKGRNSVSYKVLSWVQSTKSNVFISGQCSCSPKRPLFPNKSSKIKKVSFVIFVLLFCSG